MAHLPVRPDTRKLMSVLRAEWDGCRKCSLGEFRDKTNGNMVFGEGEYGGIMFIGEGPSCEDAHEGRPWTGDAGHILRHTIVKLGLRPVYLTNAVVCRSCVQRYDNEGNPSFRSRHGIKEPIIDDQAPTKTQCEACYPRLVEEIYMVDPKIIVTLGKNITETLLGKSWPITTEVNKPIPITIPGAGVHAVLTAKKQEWVRKTRGVFSMPTAQNAVEYLVVPVFPPELVVKRNVDLRVGNPLSMFIKGVKSAAQIYARYMLEVYGDVVVINDISEDTIQGDSK